jgi:hypothetical protein
MNRYLVLYILLCILLVVGLASCDSNEPGTIDGIITRASDGQPLANAQVTIHLLTKLDSENGTDLFSRAAVLQVEITDENGYYSATLKPIKYLFVVEYPGLEKEDQVLEVRSKRTTTVDWALEETSP